MTLARPFAFIDEQAHMQRITSDDALYQSFIL